MKLTAGIVGGFLIALTGAFAAVMLFATSTHSAYFWTAFSICVLWSLAIVFSQNAPSVLNAWSQMIGALGFMLLVIPYAMFEKMTAGFENGSPDSFYDNLLPIFMLFTMYATACVLGSIACAVISWRLDKKAKA